MADYCCTDCGEPLDFLDTISSRQTGAVLFQLWICHNEECESYGCIWNDRDGDLAAGDPSGCY